MNPATYILRGSLPSAWDALFPLPQSISYTLERREFVHLPLTGESAPKGRERGAAALHDMPHDSSMRHEAFSQGVAR